MPGLLRLIILAAIIWLIISLYRRLKNTTTSQKRDDREPTIENMVRCEVCGTHLPEKLALKKNDHYYCSQAHLQQDQ